MSSGTPAGQGLTASAADDTALQVATIPCQRAPWGQKVGDGVCLLTPQGHKSLGWNSSRASRPAEAATRCPKRPSQRFLSAAAGVTVSQLRPQSSD